MSGSAEPPDDRELIEAAQRGERHAYGRLVTKYMRRAYFVALGFSGSSHSALDLSQDAFVKAFQAIRRFDAKRNFFTWYYQILRNVCLNDRRRQKQAPMPFSAIGEARLLEIVDDSPDAGEQLEAAERREAVWQAIDALPDLQREIIVLRDFQELSYAEIAATIDCPVGTVMSRLYHARKALRAKLEAWLR